MRVRLRLDPEDDLLHAVEDASNFNESRYYNVFDPTVGLGIEAQAHTHLPSRD
jgi:hypothetical protein